jgi:hypothetical protein
MWYTTVMITHRGNTDIADRCLDFDKRVGLVVLIGWTCLAIGTEICVVANSTLVAVSNNVCCRTTATTAKRAVAVDAMVTDLAVRNTLGGCNI